MKNEILLACVIVLASVLGGCATTALTVQRPDGSKVSFRFPKNLQAKQLKVRVGDYALEADEIQTDASGVIEAKGKIASDVAATTATAVVKALAP